MNQEEFEALRRETENGLIEAIQRGLRESRAEERRKRSRLRRAFDMAEMFVLSCFLSPTCPLFMFHVRKHLYHAGR